jgi:hypothetical protein
LEYKKQWIHFICDPFRMCASLDFARAATGVWRPIGFEQHWCPPWLLCELIMAPKQDKVKTGVDKAEASKAATVAISAAGTGAVPSHPKSAMAAMVIA